MTRYIRYKREKQQINFLNCGKLNEWVDTCTTRATEFESVCESCFCDTKYNKELVSTSSYVCGSELGEGYVPYKKYEEFTSYYKDIDGSIIEATEYHNGVFSNDCVAEEEVEYDLMCTYNVRQSYTNVFNKEAIGSIRKMYVDDVRVDVQSQVFFEDYGKAHIVKFVLEDNTTLPNSFFSNINALNKVEMTDTFTSIGAYAFSYSSIEEIKLSENLVAIEDGTFNNCSNLKSIVIPNKVKELKYEAFWSCYSLSSVTLGTSVEKIGYYVFKQCPKLKEFISLNPSIVELSNYTNTFGTTSDYNATPNTGVLKYPCDETISLTLDYGLLRVRNWYKECF